jgi:transcriptional regulator with XRE-family HTH domain
MRPKSPKLTDMYVGARVRMRRMLLGMSQEKLADQLGLTFQQVQKYEKGTNRIGASRLQHIAQILEVNPAFFFEGAPGSKEATFEAGASDTLSDVTQFLATAEGLALIKAFTRVKRAELRGRIVDLVRQLGEEGG